LRPHTAHNFCSETKHMFGSFKSFFGEEQTNLILAGLHQGIENEPAAARYEAIALNMRHVPTPVEAQAIAVTRLTTRAQRAQLQAPAPRRASAPEEGGFDPSLVKQEPVPEGNFDPQEQGMAEVKQEPGVAPEPRRSSRLGSKLAKARGVVASAFDMAAFERQYLEDMPVIDVDQLIREEIAGDAPDDEIDEVQLFDDDLPVEIAETRQVPMRAVKAEPKRPELGDEEFEEIIRREEEGESDVENDKGEPEPEDREKVDKDLEGESADEKENDEDRAFIANDEPEVYVEGVDAEEEEEEDEEEDDAEKFKAMQEERLDSLEKALEAIPEAARMAALAAVRKERAKARAKKNIIDSDEEDSKGKDEDDDTSKGSRPHRKR
jgi:hypothetical protein